MSVRSFYKRGQRVEVLAGPHQRQRGTVRELRVSERPYEVLVSYVVVLDNGMAEAFAHDDLRKLKPADERVVMEALRTLAVRVGALQGVWVTKGAKYYRPEDVEPLIEEARRLLRGEEV